MEDELSKWKEIVRCRREEFYELNYYNTMQLLALRRELGKLNRGSHTVSPNVLALLQSISSQISLQIVFGAICQVTDKKTAELVSHDNAHMEGVFDLPTQDDMQMSSDDKYSSSGANLFEVPKADHNKHMPNLTEDDLNEAQKEMMINISTRLGCSKVLVLMAFEECPGNENDRYDYQKWCSDNIERDILNELNEDDGSLSDSDSEASSGSDDIDVDQHFQYSSSMSYLRA